MRTKTLLLTAVAFAAGLAVSSAQVYSQNIVGYVNVPLNAGFTMVANPLNAATNDLNTLFPNAGNGDAVYKFNGLSFDSSTFFFGSWSPDLTLNPGEGAFISSGVSNTVTFVGNVLTGNLTNNIPSGFSIRGSQVPQSATLESMGFPAGNGDAIYFFRNGTYASSTFFFGSFSPAAIPAVGEAFWVSSGTGGNWTRSFNP
jgi:hypothetical protein